ncbi:pentatricopeptide repeat-containing protein [Spatholobus suberectus]|nr:pentatricopeptide repeat-containing protein [Spatholobus suberectus]
MELKLYASMVSMGSIPRAGNSIVLTHSSSSIPFCTYAVPDASRRRNGTNTSRSTHKTPPLRKGNHPNEPKLKLDHQNQNAPLPLNVDLVALCEEGKLDQVLELMCQGAVADYRVYLALLNLFTADKLPTPQRKKQSDINMLEEKNRVTEYRYSIPYKEEAHGKLGVA